MLDDFFHNLIDTNTKADDHKIGFLDCLLLFCATVFSLFIRWKLRGFSLAGYLGGESSEASILYLDRIRLIEMIAGFLIAVTMGVILFLTQRSIRKADLGYTVVLFLPSSIALGGMSGYPDTFIAWVLFLIVWLFLYKKRIPALVCVLILGGIIWSGASYFAPMVKGFSVFEIFGYGTLAAEYAKAGAVLCVFLIVCLFFVRGEVIVTSKRGWLLFLLSAGVCCQLFLPGLPISVCLVVELLAVYEGLVKHEKIYRAILLAGINYAVVYRQMMDSTFIPAYIFSFLLLFLLLDLVWELYQTGIKAETKNKAANTAEKTTSVKKWSYAAFLLFALLLGAYGRIIFRHFESVDYRFCFKPWTDAFKLGGGFGAIAGDFYNYPPFYMYMMYLVSLLPAEPLYPLKIVSVIWDGFLALGAGLTVRECTKSDKKGILAFSLIWCLPTVVVNSALWAQCDVMYVCLVIWSLYFYAKDKPKLSMLFYAGAFSFKMQVFFVLPVYVYLWVRKKYKIYQFLYLPGLYALSCIPAWLIGGKSLKELLLLYVGQSQQEPWMLSWYWPNIYQIFGTHEFYEFLAKAGMYGAIAVTMILLYDMAKRIKNTNPQMITLMMYAYAVVIPFFLPYMHERYGYLADILAVMLFVMMPRFLPIVAGQVLISYVAYACHLHEELIVPTWIYCIPMALMVWHSVAAVYHDGKLPKIFATKE